jgi:probable phosphoglycerate mutase
VIVRLGQYPAHARVSARRATTIALVRHGQTDWNVQRRVQGSTDVPLNATGRAQAAAAAERLAAEGSWHAVVSSPLARAADTASLIADGLGLPAPEPVPALAERRYGALEGLSTAERARLRSLSVYVRGLESRSSVADRAISALLGIAETHPGRSIVAVTHGGVIQAVLLHLGLPKPGSGAIANGSVHELRVVGDRVSFVWSEAYDDAESTGTG